MKKQKVAVGYYKDKDGETHPITKSTRELNQKHIVTNPKQFKGINPQLVQIQRQVESLKHDVQNIDKQVDSHAKAVNELKQRFEQCQASGDTVGAQNAEKNMTKTAFVLDQLSKKRDQLTQKIQQLEHQK